MAGTKINKPQDCRRSLNKKLKPEVEHMRTQSTIRSKNASKSNMETYLDLRNQEYTWMDDRKIELLAKEMIEWALNNDVYKLSCFYTLKGLGRDLVNRWRKKWPEFNDTVNYVKQLIGDRREEGAMKKQFDSNLVVRSMPLYDEDWKEETVRIARLKDEEKTSEASKTINIVMQSFKEVDEKV